MGDVLKFKVFLYGGVSEWPKEHAWKACVRQKRTVGSNPTSSEIFSTQQLQSFLMQTNIDKETVSLFVWVLYGPF